MTAPISRLNRAEQLAVGTSSATGVAGIDFRSFGGGRVQRATGATIANVTVFEADAITGPWTACQVGGADVTINLSSGKSQELPTGLFAASFLLFVGDVAGNAILRLKS
jgi:hypothetical protein